MKLTMEDLPPPDARWMASRKALVVEAVDQGLLTLDQVCERYGLTTREFHTWRAGLILHGRAGLRATRLQVYTKRHNPI